MTEYGSGGSFTVTMDGPYSGGGSTSAEKLTLISAPVANWKGGTSPYSQVVTVAGININSKIDIQLSADQIEQLSDQIITFTAENDAGIVTLYAIGDKPAIDCVFQATLSDVVNISEDNLEAIRGNTVSTNTPRSDFEQKDDTKADFVKNNPSEEIEKAINQAKNALPKAGGTMTGDIHMNSFAIDGLDDPTKDDQATNKKYVDTTVKEYVNSSAASVETFSSVTLPSSGWQNKQITADVPNVSSDGQKCHVIISPDPEEANYLAYCEANVRGISQGEGKITFGCTDTPEKDLKINIRVRRLPE